MQNYARRVTQNARRRATALYVAMDQAYRGRKLDSALPWDGVQRSLRSEITVLALVVDAKDDQAETFYRHHGFVSFGSQPKQLLLPVGALSVVAGASGNPRLEDVGDGKEESVDALLDPARSVAAKGRR